MHWSMVGWSHHRTPIDMREKLAFSSQQVEDALRKFTSSFNETESVLLSTCNRVELYTASKVADKLPPPDQQGRFLAEYHGFDFSELQEQVTTLTGEQALRHLFMVASSLDSLIVGEAQILAQVKAAYELACSTEAASTLMHRAFQRAATVAKRVASETDIHRKRISVPSVAVSEIASDFFERFDDKRILLIGAGDMGTETLRYLIDAGAKSVRVINRNQERAKELAKNFDASVKPWENLHESIAESDLIVSTTSSSVPIITADEFKKLRSRKSPAVLILDLAVPRDFDPAIANLSDVYLFAVDDLQAVCDRNIKARQAQWPKAERIVEQETTKFLGETIHHSSGPTIKQLRDQAQQVKEDELQRLLTKLNAQGIDESVQKELKVSFDRLVNKLLHPPLQSLREHADSSNHASLVDALRRLFQLKD